MTSLKHLSTPLLVCLALSGTACSKTEEPAAKQSQAVAAAAPAAEAAAAAGATEIPLSKASGSIGFKAAKVTASHEGSFTDYSGTISLVEGDPTKSVVKVTIPISSLQVEPAKLRTHLLSPDLLDAEKFPNAEFVSTSIKAGAAAPATHTVTGNFTLHGVKKSITFPATISVSGKDVSVDSEFNINRKDFGVVYPGMPDDLIQDDVLIRLKLAAKGS